MLAQAQDLNSGELALTLIPGRIRDIRFAEGTSSRANAWNALPAHSGDLLNLRDIEQALRTSSAYPPPKPTSRSPRPRPATPAPARATS